ncbi:MAG: preprotein translocase subunit SecA [Candidatus Electryonea clarkiae]|nr:preprotein translocase subunit SecA [Candidatus Electryonea clarkiae]MDP8288029.1 preprotein translocase subunit SecA [Candidatus Electryonea clarkiae]
MKFIEKIFGNRHEKEMTKVQPIVDEINENYETLHDLSDEELRAKTDEFRSIISERAAGYDKYAGLEPYDPERERKAAKNEVENIQEILDELLPEVFAVIKEVCRRLKEGNHTFVAAETEMSWDMIPFDVQLIGGIMLHRGKIAEMATGEGKTLAATMPLYLNALAGRGAHLVTVNDYLARRDAEWMGQIYEFLGLTIGTILTQMPASKRREQYVADITYGTNNEFGFDYLRDNMSTDPENMVQRGHHFAIVDEVDSVLIDEARTPLIIAGPVPRSTGEGDFVRWNPMIKSLVQKQRDFVARLMTEAEKTLKEVEEEPDGAKEFEAGIKLFQASKGAPKNKRVIKTLGEGSRKRLVQGVEDTYIRDKRVHELEEDLYYVIDEKAHAIDLTDKGREELARIEKVDIDFFTLPDLTEIFVDLDNDQSLSDEEKAEKKSEAEQGVSERSGMIHSMSQLLRAHSLYMKDGEYVLENGKVQIVDEFTGRIMYGRRYSDGLHQAIEAKENVKVEAETQTIATVTLQNYFRLYGKLAGMTGTAETEEDEFFKIYKLEVSVIPTNRPIDRYDHVDEIYRTQREKYAAIINEIMRLHELGLPMLVGTTSVDTSELISRMLGSRTVDGRKLKDRIQVLNAKQHQSEAEIVIRAGRPGAITIATNMAGRGTDIKISNEIADAHGENGVITKRLEQNPDLRDRHIEEYRIDPLDQPGGLQIIGTERHEARRIDRQLRGRAGRQGDPGRSKFYLSLEDDLMRLFGGERIGKVMDTLGIQEGEVIAHSMVTKAIEKAQKRVEQHNFSIREHLLKYDDVMNIQREVVYARRRAALSGDIRSEVSNLIEEYIAVTLDNYCDPSGGAYSWDIDGLRVALLRTLMIDVHLTDEEKETLSLDDLEAKLITQAKEALERRRETFGDELYDKLLRYSVLRVVDQEWMDHLYKMDRLKEGIGLRSYAQRDPLIEYKREGLEAFEQMLARIAESSLRAINSAQIRVDRAAPEYTRQIDGREIKDDARESSRARMMSPEMAENGTPQVQKGGVRSRPQAGARAGKAEPVRRVQPKVSRNAPCPCGSGKKYKHCHGR